MDGCNLNTTYEQKCDETPADIYFGETSIASSSDRYNRLFDREHHVQELAKHSHSYEQLIYLLLEGRWPTHTELTQYCERLAPLRDLPEGLLDLIERRKQASPDLVLQTCLSYLSGAPDQLPECRIVIVIPSIVATHNALRRGLQPPPPDLKLGIAEDFLRRLLRRPISKLEATIINIDFILNAGYNTNASTFAARIATSTLTSPIHSIIAAVATFSGTRCGSEIARAADMIDQLEAKGIQAFVPKQKRSKDAFRGIGFQDNKDNDCRAYFFQRAAKDLCSENHDKSLLKKIKILNEAIESYEGSNASPDSSLYAAIVYRHLGIDRDLLTAVSSIPQIPFWLAHVKEQRKGSNLLIRPLLQYVDHISN